MNTKNNIWYHIKKDLQTDISRAEFKRWLADTSLAKIDADEAVIEVPNKFIAQWIEENYIHKIQTTLKHHSSIHPKIVFTYTSPTGHETAIKNIGVETPDATFPYAIDPLNTFDSFITSGCNQLAYSSALNMAGKAASGYNPLYIFSPISLGKTHLLHAIGNRVLSNEPTSNVLYLSTQHLLSCFPPVRLDTKIYTFKPRKARSDCLLVDDINLLADRPGAQKDILYIFDLFLEFNQRLALTANSAPSKVQKLIPDLRSRLESGLITEIQPPDHKTKMRIIKKKADLQNLTLPEDVIFFLAGATHNLKTLHRTVEGLKAHCTLTGEDIDISMAQNMTSGDSLRRISLSHIQSATAQYFNIPVAELLSEKKSRAFSYPRQIAMYLSKDLTQLPLKTIGEAFGHKHHTSVMYSINRIKTEKKRNNRVIKDINELQKRLII